MKSIQDEPFGGPRQVLTVAAFIAIAWCVNTIFVHEFDGVVMMLLSPFLALAGLLIWLCQRP